VRELDYIRDIIDSIEEIRRDLLKLEDVVLELEKELDKERK